MKVRSGFVSNSSSSSFLLIGFKANKAQIKKHNEMCDNEELDPYYDFEMIDELDLIGFSISASNGETECISLEYIKEKTETLKSIFGNDIVVELWVGTRYT